MFSYLPNVHKWKEIRNIKQCPNIEVVSGSFMENKEFSTCSWSREGGIWKTTNRKILCHFQVAIRKCFKENYCDHEMELTNLQCRNFYRQSNFLTGNDVEICNCLFTSGVTERDNSLDLHWIRAKFTLQFAINFCKFYLMNEQVSWYQPSNKWNGH